MREDMTPKEIKEAQGLAAERLRCYEGQRWGECLVSGKLARYCRHLEDQSAKMEADLVSGIDRMFTRLKKIDEKECAKLSRKLSDSLRKRPRPTP